MQWNHFKSDTDVVLNTVMGMLSDNFINISKFVLSCQANVVLHERDQRLINGGED